ncbi:sigma factor [Bacillus sp. FJAT-27264]|uniref:sigma-70 family RNA polymerase sigma factor n=1 Tax=Paenibacillus sp. (strain DSM 101736 / FJAT-27264) TaxID=1850362 RepID=UPI002570708C|nr:sigma factor [Bacillus sp. FJAT-27264]
MELIKACKRDKDLLGDFFTENRDFIFSIIKHFKGNVEELRAKFRVTDDELYQHACIGILIALQDFNFDRGIKFTTYVVRPILWEINQLLYSDSQSVRLSRGAVDLIKRMVEIENTLGYRPNEEEMSELLGISVERYREIAMFSDDLEHYDAIDNFDIADTKERVLEDEVTNKVYVEQLLVDSMFTDFEKKVMAFVMEESNNTQIAEKLNVYPMTINRTLARIRQKIESKEANVKEEKVIVASKYEREITIIAQEIKERNNLMCIEDITELLEVCEYPIEKYTTRVLYYMRQKAIQKLDFCV